MDKGGIRDLLWIASIGVSMGSSFVLHYPRAIAAGNYVSAVRSGNLVFLAGHLPYDDAGKLIVGKVDFAVSSTFNSDIGVTSHWGRGGGGGGVGWRNAIAQS